MPFVSDGEVRVHYEVMGNTSGAPLVLHPGGCGDRRSWAFAGYLAAVSDFRCITIDHRGRGLSDRPRSPAAHRMERYVSDVMRVLDAMGIEKAAFWGYSDGGRVGFATASRHPGRIVGLVSTGNWGQWMSREYYSALVRSIRTGGMPSVVREVEGNERFTIADPLRTNLLETDPEMNALNEEVWSEERAELVSAGFRTPTMMVVGETEDPSNQSGELAGRLPEARAVRLKGLGHFGTFIRSELSLDQARSFLASLG